MLIDIPKLKQKGKQKRKWKRKKYLRSKEKIIEHIAATQYQMV